MKTKIKKPLTEAELLAAKAALEDCKRQQTILRDKELAIREELANELHDGEEGSRTITIGGTKVSITRNINRSIRQEDADRLKQDDKKLWAECLKFRPEVAVRAYKEHREFLDDYITSKPGPSTVEFK